MIKYKPKKCINSTCNNIMYIDSCKMHMLLQCNACIEKRKNIKND